jgi:hypothetical protein
VPALALLTYWKPIALAALIAAALIYRTVLIHQRDEARTEAATLTERNAALTADNGAMRAAVARQNAAIASLQSQMTQARAAAASRAADYTTRGAQAMQTGLAQGNQLKAAAVPTGCDAAIRWGNAQGPELGRW